MGSQKPIKLNRVKVIVVRENTNIYISIVICVKDSGLVVMWSYKHNRNPLS